MTKKCVYTTPAAYEKQEMDWGTITWFVTGPLDNSENLTVGRSTIKVGCQNPLHLKVTGT